MSEDREEYATKTPMSQSDLEQGVMCDHDWEVHIVKEVMAITKEVQYRPISDIYDISICKKCHNVCFFRKGLGVVTSLGIVIDKD